MNTREEIKKCMDSPAYFYNMYCKVVDREGNEISKPVLTDEQIRQCNGSINCTKRKA